MVFTEKIMMKFSLERKNNIVYVKNRAALVRNLCRHVLHNGVITKIQPTAKITFFRWKLKLSHSFFVSFDFVK